ncbi:MAG: hypothetical protein AABW88_01580 [Nanoarchaeota archaeon]
MKTLSREKIAFYMKAIQKLSEIQEDLMKEAESSEETLHANEILKNIIKMQQYIIDNS